MQTEIYLGTILMELNRWSSDKPVIKVSEWLERIHKDGFAGLELWENHIFRAESPQKEIKALKKAKIPVAIYNSYVGFGSEDRKKRQKAAEYINELGARGVKYNLGHEEEMLDTYVDNLKKWDTQLPEGCRLLCECHGGTVLEEPAVAKKVFADLGKECYQAIVHCFNEPDKLKEWFVNLGDRITHAHVSVKDENGQGVRLRNAPERVEENLRIMKNYNYRGTFTLEFTEGLRSEDENPEDSYRAAVDDLQYLTTKWKEINDNE
ncbi:MAG: sugar phosphate isomerase/epimerase family protein [Halanaerobiales bacterium]